MPDALAAGVPYDVFWHLSPRKLKAFYKAHRTRRELRDEEMWYLGQYMYSSVLTALDHFINGSKAKAKYVEKPFRKKAEDIFCDGKHQYNESREEVAVYEMKQRTKIIEQQGLPMSPE